MTLQRKLKTASHRSANRKLFFEPLEERKVLTAASAVVSAASLAGMNQLYAINNDQFDFNDAYLVNNAASNPTGSFDRVAYFFEIGPVGSAKWVWVSMDTFNPDPLLVGVPRAGTNIVQNGTVVSNVKIETSAGSGVTPISVPGTSGILEFWASNYGPDGGGAFGSNNGLFDWKDSGGTTGGGHGSFQVSAFTNSPTNTAAQVVFNVTAGGGAGIGNQIPNGPNGSADWTFGTGTGGFAIRNLEIWVGKENAPPTISNIAGDSLTYTPGVSGVQVIDQGTAAVANDPPPVAPNAWNTGNLTVSIPAGGVSADDILSVRNQGNGAGQIGFAAGTVSFGGTPIGTATGGTGGTNLVITFNAAASSAAVSALLSNITFLNTNVATAASTRLTRFVLTDGNGLSSAASNAVISMNVGGAVATYVWDGDSDGDGDGISFTDALNWNTNVAPDSNDIAIFRTADPGPVNVGANTFVGEVRFDGAASNFTLQNGTLNTNRIDQQGAATGTNTITAQISSVLFTGIVSGGQLNLANTANSASIGGGLWTINGGGKIVTTTSGANTGIGKANVDANGGTLEFGAGASTTVSSLIERWYPNVFADTNLIIDASAANNTDVYLALTPDSTSSLSTNLGNFDTNALLTRSPSNMAPFGNRFGATWSGSITVGGGSSIPAGDVSFGTSSDDGSAIYVDSNSNGTFESTELVVDNRGNHGNQSRIGTVNLPAGTYGVYIAYFESSGGGNVEARVAAGNGIAYASQTIINPTTQTGVWSSQAIAAGDLTNNVRVLANSTLIMGSTLPGVKLNQLTMNAGTMLLVQSPDGGQDLEFASTVLNGNATIDSTGRPDITLRNISETAGSSLTFSGNAVVLLPTANTYTGQTTINSGVTVNVSANNALGTAANGTTVQAGGSLRLSGNVLYTTTEALTLNGTGTSVSDAALNNLSGNNDWSGPITLAGVAKIRDANGTMRLLGQVDGGGNNLELRADGQMEITTGLSGSGVITKTGGNRTIIHATANAGTTFSGQLNINEGIWDARANNGLGTVAGGTVIANNARLELQGGITLADSISVMGNGNTAGAIRNENGSNTLSGTVTLTGATEFFLNDTQLTINNAMAGNQVLTKSGVGTLILRQNNALSNFLLRGGEVRISTINGLGSTSALTVGGGQALEFDASLTFNSGTTLQALTINNGTLNAISGTTILDIPITLGVLSKLSVGGAGNLVLQRAFGNGGSAVSTANSLNHFGYHINNDNVVMNLNANGGMMNGVPPNPAAFTSFFGSTLLTNGPINQGLRFTNDNDFISTGNIGQVDNYSNLFLGILRVTAATAGTWNFRINQQDDPTGIWLDLNQDGIFQSNGALNSGQNEQLAWNDTGNKTANLVPGDYMIAFTHREGGGGSVIDARFRSPTMGAEAIVNPSNVAQANIWSSFPFVPNNGVTKFGAGTVTLLGANNYNGTTTVNAGTLIAGNNTALGLAAAGTTVANGATLGFSDPVGITVTSEAITANGAGAAGQPGSIANILGNNTYTGAVTAVVASAGTLGIGSTAGTLTLNGTIDQRFSQLTFNGAGNVIVNSVISGNGVSALAGGVTETIFNGTVSDPQTNIEAFRNQALVASDGRGVLLGNLSYADDAAVSARAAALGAVGFDNGDFAMLWTTSFTPNESGVWQFQFGNEDDNAGVWLDTTGAAGVFEIGDRIYNRACCGASGVINTPSLVAGQPYLLGIVMNDTGGGGNFTNMQFKSPSAAGWGGGAFTTINATNFPNAFQIQTIANNAVVKNGAGTVTLAGANTYNGVTTINNGALIAAHNAALGANSVGTTVVSGSTLGLSNNITLTDETLTVNGIGAAAQPGAIANISGSNTIAASTPINVQVVSLGQIGIGATAGTLTIAAPLDLKSSALVVSGAGNVVLNGVISGTGVDVGGNPPENIGAVTGVFTNVPEANNYILAYELANIPNAVNGATSFVYSRNNSATIQPFDRIAYYMELQVGAGPLTYVYASMNAFTSNINQIGIPNGQSGPAATRFKWQQIVANMNVFSNAPTSGAGAITTGTGIATGNIEIWPSNYGGNNDITIPNAAGSFDFGDGGSNTNDGYGSFQIHNHDIDGAGPGTSGQVLMAYNNWRNGTQGDLGIGTRTTGEPDYTFANNLPTYAVKRMAILVRETTPRLIQTNNSLIKNGSGTLTLVATNTYNGVTTVAGGNLVVNGSIATSVATVQTGATLSGSGTTGVTTVNAGATHAPGNPLQLQTVTGNYVENGALQIQIATPAGNVAGTDYDQVRVIGNGSVALGATATLNVTYTGTPGTFAAPTGQTYTIINNDGTVPGDTIGTFVGLPEGAIFNIDGRPFAIQYHGGDGNDVVLVAQSVTPTTIYVNDQFTGSGAVDGDLETAGTQSATIGTTAFASIAAGLAAWPGYVGTIVVNGGTYASALLAGSGDVTLQLVQDLTAGEFNVTVNNLSGDATDRIITRFNNAANANLIVTTGSFAGVISGTGGVVKTTTGTVTFTGANTYDGLTDITAGILLITNPAGLGSTVGATTVASNAQLRIDGGITVTGESLTINGLGDIGSQGALNSVSGNNTWSGPIIIGTTTTNNRVGATAGTLTLSGVISGGQAGTHGGLTVRNGTGVTIVTGGSNTYLGDTTVVVGTLRIAGGDDRLPLGSKLAVGNVSSASPAVFDLNGFNQTVAGLNSIDSTLVINVTNSGALATLTVNSSAGTDTYNGVISGALNLTKTGAGVLALGSAGGNGANTYTGATLVSGGRLHLTKTAGQNAIPGNLDITTGGLVSFGANNQIVDTATVTMSGAGSIFNGTAFNAGQLASLQETIANLTVTGGAFQTGSSSTWNITGAASFTGGAGNTIFLGNSGSAISFGSLSLTGMTATPGGTVQTNNSFAVYGGGPAIGTVTVGAGGLSLSGSVLNLRRGGAVSNPGSQLVLNGNLTASGTSGIVLDAGGGANGAADVQLSGVAGAANRSFDVAAAGLLMVSANVTNGAATPGSLTKVGAGTMLLSGANSYSGATAVNTGTLQLQGGTAIADAAGAVSVGLGGTLQLLASETVSSYVGAGESGAGTNDSTLALSAFTLTTAGDAAIANVTTSGGAIVAGTTIFDADDDNNVTGTGIVLQAAAGVGTAANPIETTLANLEASGGSGGVFIANIGNLTIGSVGLANGISASGDDVVLVAAGSVTVAESIAVTGAGNEVIITSTDAAGAGQDIIMNAAAIISSAAAGVTLNAGDNATINGTLVGSTQVSVNVDFGNLDGGVGGVLVFAGDVDAPLAVFSGAADTAGDSFNVRPDQDVGDVLTPLQVLGLAPNANPNGDSLTLNIAALGTPTLTLGPGSRNGAFSFAATAASVQYNNIESVGTSPAQPFHVVLDMKFSGFENGVADFIVAQLDAAGANLLLDVNGGNVFAGPDNIIQSLTIIGSADNDTFQINESVGGLPRFTGAAPAVNNSGLGGGVSAGSHLGAAADLVLETLQSANGPWDASDVTLHFDGAGGTDALAVNFTTANNTGYFSDTNDAGNSGTLSAASGVFPAIGVPNLLMSFANIEPLVLSGAGGSLLTDATGTPATSTLTLTDIGTQTQVTGDAGFAPTSFSGFNALAVFGGDGVETLNIVSVDSGALTAVSLWGGNTNNLLGLPGGDTSADTLRVQSLAVGATATLVGNAGNDLFQLFNSSNTVDNIAGQVIVDGTDGSLAANTDTLTIIDTGDGSGDSALIGAVNAATSQDYFIDGVTGVGVLDVIFRNIDVLNYTGTSGGDTIDGQFANTTPQHDLSIVTLNGWTGADQFLLFTSDQAGGTGMGVTPTGVASGVAVISLNGDAPGNPNGVDGNDVFGQTVTGLTGTGAGNVGLTVDDTVRNIRPSVSTAIVINGGQPTGPALPTGDTIGDVLNLDLSSLPPSAALVLPTASGVVTTSGLQPLSFAQIEDINLAIDHQLINAQMGDTLVVGSSGQDLIQFMRAATNSDPNLTRVRVNTLVVDFSATGKTLTFGGALNDYLTQANVELPAEMHGGAGDDYISGGIANDYLVGGLGNDQINASSGDNVVWGDNIPTFPADPTPQDSAVGGSDNLSALGGNDVFYGGGGNDSVSAGGGNDYLYGGQGHDMLDGSMGDDRVYGGAGDDVLGGSAGNDLLSGGTGNDNLLSGTGNDVLIAGAGADNVDGGSGNDLLISGSVSNGSSSWTSVASVGDYAATNYSNPGDNDAALLALLTSWSVSGDRTSLGTIAHDGADDDLMGSTGDDDFCWEAADLVDEFPKLTPPDYNAPGMGADERFGPT